MIKTKINLSENQVRKIAIAHKNNTTSVRIRLSPKRIKVEGKYKILLNKTQKEKLDDSKK